MAGNPAIFALFQLFKGATLGDSILGAENEIGLFDNGSLHCGFMWRRK